MSRPTAQLLSWVTSLPIPEFDSSTGNLPEGDHVASWAEINKRFGWSFRRRELLRELELVLRGLRTFGVGRCWLDGSFVTRKDRPGDIDVVCLPPDGADITTWNRFAPAQRKLLKQTTRIDLWHYPAIGLHLGGAPRPILDFFGRDRDNHPKGFVLIELGDLPT